MAPQGIMCLFLLMVMLHTAVLITLFFSQASSQTETSNVRNDIVQLQHNVDQLTHTLTAMLHQHSSELKTFKEDLDSLVKGKEERHIRHTHPGLMQYRHMLTDPNTNPGDEFRTKLKATLVLLEENGVKYWGWKDTMVNWVFELTTPSGESMVRAIFKNVLGRETQPRLVLDVGSNTGLFSMIAAVYQTKRVYAFDPQPDCARRVAVSARMNGFDDRVAVINAFVAEDDTRVSPVPLRVCRGSFKMGTYTGTNLISSVNLDKYFLDDPDAVDLMKVDVEGAELLVLQGSKELFKQHRIRSLVIEITPGWWPTAFNISFENGVLIVKELLVDTGYKVWLLTHNATSEIIGWENLEKEMRPPNNDELNQKNYLFTLEKLFP